uniref:Putative terminase n=1 Tax=viral metagenome TaxID=1070528 RepID=A0A6M3LEF2_9ZZZZ
MEKKELEVIENDPSRIDRSLSKIPGQPGNMKSRKFPNESWKFMDSKGIWGDTANATRARTGKKRALQEKFLHVYHRIGDFCITDACNAIGLNRSRISTWKTDDEWFVEAMEMIEEEKKDFIESGLLKKVRKGDTAAVIFAAKTKLRDRGYGEHRTIEQNITRKFSKEQIDAIARAKRSIESDIIDVTPEKESLKPPAIMKMLPGRKDK